MLAYDGTVCAHQRILILEFESRNAIMLGIGYAQQLGAGAPKGINAFHGGLKHDAGKAVLLELLALLGIYFSLDIGIGASVDRRIAGFLIHIQDIHQGADYLVLLIDLTWVNRDVIAVLARSKDIAIAIVDSSTLGVERLIVDAAPIQLILGTIVTKHLVSSKLESACSARQTKKRQNERASRHRFTRHVCMQQVGLWSRPAGTCSAALSGLRGPKTCYGIVVMVVLVLWHEAPGI